MEHKVVSVEYFLEEITDWEVAELLDLLPWADRATWESARMQAYINASIWCKKSMAPEDLVTLPWEKSSDNTIPITDAELEAAKRDGALLGEKLKKIWQEE